MPDKNPDVRIAIFHELKLLGRWTALLYGVVALSLVAGLVVNNGVRNRIEDVQNDTVKALCTFRADLQTRYENGIKFLVDHPDGIPGIPAETLQQSLDNQKDTLESLRALPCGPHDGTSVLGQRARPPRRENFIDAVNRERDCNDLRSTGKYLHRKARRHSKRMAAEDRLFHSNLQVGRFRSAGEVVGVGPHWQSIFAALMDSRPHRRILKDCRFDLIAVGIVDSGGRTWLTARVYEK